jgi:transcriptional regulator with XRE-family HTH domain
LGFLGSYGEGPVQAVRFDELEPFREIVVGVMNRQQRSTGELARAIGCERTYLSKVRSGARPLSPSALEKLVIELKVDRKRMALAAVVMGSPALYFDPAFKNLSHYVQALLISALELSEAEDRRHGMLLASLSRDRCEQLAQQAIAQLAEKFASVDSMLGLARTAAA